MAAPRDTATVFLAAIRPLRKRAASTSEHCEDPIGALCGTTSVERSQRDLFPTIQSVLKDDPNDSERQHEQTTRCSIPDPVANPLVPSAPLTPPATAATSEVSREELSPSQNQATPTTNINGLKIFNREVEDAIQNHARNVMEQLGSALLDYLSRRRVEFRPMSLQLMVLGNTENDATPWIVVLCPAKAKKKVERYLQNDAARNIDDGPPNRQYKYHTTVYGRPLETKASESLDEVFVEQEDIAQFEDWTPQIKVGQLGIVRYATLGGFVCIVDAKGSTTLYGLTAGHVLPPCDLYTDDDDMLSDSDTEDESDEHDEDHNKDNGNRADDTCNADVRPSQETEDQNRTGNNQELDVEEFPGYRPPDDRVHDLEDCAQDKHTWTSLGKMSKASYTRRAQNRDWALVELSIPGEQLKDSHEAPPKELRKAVRFSDHTKAVIGDRHRKQCLISTLPARVILPSGREFVDAYTLRLSSNECKCTFQRTHRH
jgi:hypothetical protein